MKFSIGDLIKRASAGAADEWLGGPTVDKSGYRSAAEQDDRNYEAVMKLARDRGRGWAATSVLATALAGGLWWSAQGPAVQPVFIPFNSVGDPGEVFIARANEPPSLMRVWQAENAVRAMFAISSDSNVNAGYQEERDNFLRGEARTRWDEWFRRTSGTATERQVAIVSSKEKGGNVVNVIWDEVDWKDGGRGVPRRMNGDFTIEYVAPLKAGQIVLNKSGLFLTNMTFAPERGGVQ